MADPNSASRGTYTDYAKRYSVTTISTGPAAAQVRVLIPGVNTPTLMFVNPVDQAVVTGNVPVSVVALDRVGTTKVELSPDETLLRTIASAPYNFNWNIALGLTGKHQLTAKAYNQAGQTFSQTIGVTIAQVLVVAISKPVSSDVYFEGRTIP